MGIDVELRDGRGTSNKVKVTSRGQLIVAPLEFSTAYTLTVASPSTAYNLVPPKMNHRFVITDILLYADKGVGASDARVNLYEATSATATTIDVDILDIEMVKSTARDMTGLNLIVTESRWVNIKTDDSTIYATVMGYYITT